MVPFGVECQPQAEHSSNACGYVVGLDLRASDVLSIVIDVGCSCMLSLHKASRPRDSSSKFSTTVRTAHVASVTSTVKTVMMTLALSSLCLLAPCGLRLQLDPAPQDSMQGIMCIDTSQSHRYCTQPD